MTGRWQLAATGCVDCTQHGPTRATEPITLSISTNQRIEAFRDNQLLYASNFALTPSYNAGYFMLKTLPVSDHPYTYGVVELCKNKLILNSGYVDGLIYYFERLP